MAPERALLTGATGFIGAHLLSALLDGPVREVRCVVRAGSDDAARERLLRTLGDYRLRDEARWARVTVVRGDLALPRLGLDQRTFERTAAEVDAVYHCGAWVNFAYPYEVLKAANVEGTRTLIQLAAAGGPGRVRLHFVSTISVFEGPYYQRLGRVAEELPVASSEGLVNGYAQSKWVADRLVAGAADRGVPVTVFRPGRATGHQATGVHNPRDALALALHAGFRVGALPRLDVEIRPVPVDWMAGTIAEISLAGREATGRAVHLVHPAPIPWTAFVELARTVDERLRVVDMDDWWALVERVAAETGDPQLRQVQFLAGGPDGAGPQPEYDLSNLAALAPERYARLRRLSHREAFGAFVAAVAGCAARA